MRTSKDTSVSSQLLVGLGILADDERYMKRALKSVNRLVAEKQKEEEKEEPCCFSIDELNDILDRGVESIENGEYIDSTEMFAKIKRDLPYLCE